MLTFVSFKSFQVFPTPIPPIGKDFYIILTIFQRLFVIIPEVHVVFTISAFCADLSIDFIYKIFLCITLILLYMIISVQLLII
jgi:hypothetical protein